MIGRHSGFWRNWMNKEKLETETKEWLEDFKLKWMLDKMDRPRHEEREEEGEEE